MDRKPPLQTEDHAYAARPRETRLCLTVALGPQKPFVVVLPPGGDVSVGRDPKASLGLGNPTLSRLHFAIAGLSGEVTLRDLGSRNGTLLEGARIYIEEPPGQAWCMACARSVAIAQRGDPCPACGGYQLQPTGGMELRVIDMRVSDDVNGPR